MGAPQIFSGRVEQPGRGGIAVLRRRLPRVLHTVWLWHERSRQRRQLRFLSDYMLRDLGLMRIDVQVEVSKPFWRG